MIYKKVASYMLVSAFIFSFPLNRVCARQAKKAAQENPPLEAQQQMTDFSLAGYGEKGVKNWDISGESADIFENVVKLSNVTGNMYGEENVTLKASRGDFDKAEGKVFLEDNVIITTSKGTKLTTDSLNWDRKNQVVSTNDQVNITRENIIAQALGAIGQPSLNKVTLGKEVKVDINPSSSAASAAVKNKIEITCDGPLEIDYQKNIATFSNNVKVETEDRQIYSDIMEVYFRGMRKEASHASEQEQDLMAGSDIEKIVSRGNVKIVSGDNVSYSDEAVYTASDKKIVLSGRPRLVIKTTEEFK